MRIFLLLVGIFLVASGVPAIGQTIDAATQHAPLPDALSPESISELASRLDPEQVEALAGLIELLGRGALSAPGEAAAGGQSPGLLDMLSNFAAQIGSNIVLFPQMLLEVIPILAGVIIGLGGIGVVKLVGLVAVAVGAGLLAELIVNRGLTRWKVIAKDVQSDRLVDTLGVLGWRLAFNVGGLAAFAVVALAIVRASGMEVLVTSLASSLVLLVILFPRIVAVFLRFFLSPKRAELRLVSADTKSASQVMTDLVVISAIMGVALFLFSHLTNAAPQIAASFRFWFAAIVIGLIVFSVWRNRAGLTGIIQGEDELTPGLERMAAWWPGISVAFIILNWLMIQFLVSNGQSISPMQGAMTLLLILALPFFDTALRGLVRHQLPALSTEGHVAEMAHRETHMSLIRSGRVVLIVLVLIATGKLWGISLQDVAHAGFGAQFAAGAFGLLLTIAVGYIAWEIVNLWIYQRLLHESPALDTDEQADAGGEGGGAALSRMATILPLLRLTLQVTIIALTILLAASQLGINIAPLLAGAGVFGLAIGFGAQTLVKDIVSGVFFLLDDSFRMGEFIDVGGTVGSVERISVRSLQLRHPSGTVHIIPYGEIPKIANNSRDWVIVKMKFIVPFETDLDKARKLFKKIGQEMYEDNPYYAENIIQPFKFQGVSDVDDVGITVRGKFMTKPGSQFMIRKDVYSRVQKAFDENGIEFARREVRVKIPEGDETASLTETQKTTIATAATETVQASQQTKPA